MSFLCWGGISYPPTRPQTNKPLLVPYLCPSRKKSDCPRRRIGHLKGFPRGTTFHTEKAISVDLSAALRPDSLRHPPLRGISSRTAENTSSIQFHVHTTRC